MVRQEHVLSVFVASPSDVEAERGKLEDVIRELNVAWSRELGIRLELVQWETHSYPGFGTDAQDVINDQIPNDYDLFVGIMWCRYGTPTGRAGSGTIEEFERAKYRYDHDKNSVQLMVYFKDEPVPPSQLDLKQYASVKSFQSSLGPAGGLYWKFDEINQFEKLIRLHLTRQVQAWKSRMNLTSTAMPVDTKDEKQPDEDDEGILDLMEVFQDRFAELPDILDRITDATEELGRKFVIRNDELNALPKDARGKPDQHDAKRLLEKLASDMNLYTARLEAELPLYSTAINTGINAFIKATTMSVDLNNDFDDVEQALNAVNSLRSTLATSRHHVVDFRQMIASSPRTTTTWNKARRSTVAAMDKLLTELTNSDVLLAESAKVIGGLLE